MDETINFFDDTIEHIQIPEKNEKEEVKKFERKLIKELIGFGTNQNLAYSDEIKDTFLNRLSRRTYENLLHFITIDKNKKTMRCNFCDENKTQLNLYYVDENKVSIILCSKKEYISDKTRIKSLIGLKTYLENNGNKIVKTERKISDNLEHIEHIENGVFMYKERQPKKTQNNVSKVK